MRHWVSQRVDGREIGAWRIGGTAHYGVLLEAFHFNTVSLAFMAFPESRFTTFQKSDLLLDP